MTRYLAIVLFVLGAIEVCYGVFVGRLRIYAHEAPLALELRLGELAPEQQRAYLAHIRSFQDQWHVVTLFGVVTAAAAIALWWCSRKQA